MSCASPTSQRFICTLGGSIADGRRRLGYLLGALTLLMVSAVAVSWAAGQLVPGLLALAVILAIATAWRLSDEPRPRSLELQENLLTIRTDRRQVEVVLAGARARRLEQRDIRHLERLASVGGFVAGAGGFDSHLLGEFDLYASNLDNAVLVHALESRLIVTPDRPEDFVRTLHRFATAPPATILSP
jgi:hypothetical protein